MPVGPGISLSISDRQGNQDRGQDRFVQSSAIRLTLAPTAHPMLFEDRALLFLSQSQDLCELNGSAVALIARLIAGADLADLCAPGSADAEGREDPGPYSAVKDALIDWSERGLIHADVTDPPGTSFTKAFLAAGPTTFELTFPEDEFGAAVASPYGHLPRLGIGTVSVDVRAVRDLAVVSVRGGQARIVRRNQVATRLHNTLLQCLLDDENLVAVHAACMKVEGRAVLLCGSPGTGKSTFGRAMAGCCEGFCGDDVVVFDRRTGMVMAVPFPHTTKIDGAFAKLAGDRFGQVIAEMRADGVWVRYDPLPNAAPAQWLEIGHFIALERHTGAEVKITPWPKMDALRTLFAEAHAFGGRSDAQLVRSLLAAVSKAKTYRLRYVDSKDAISDLVSHLVSN